MDYSTKGERIVSVHDNVYHALISSLKFVEFATPSTRYKKYSSKDTSHGNNKFNIQYILQKNAEVIQIKQIC